MNKIQFFTAGELRQSKPSASDNFLRRKKSEKDFIKFMKWSSMLYSKGYTRMQEVHNIIWKALCDENYIAVTENRTGAGLMMRDRFINDYIEKFPSWKNVKKIVFNRDDNKCTKCGSDKFLEAHHIKQVRFGGIPLERNLITLCRSCHKKEDK